MATVAPEQVVKGTATTSVQTTTLTTTAVIAVGRVVVIGMDRAATATTNNGLSGVATAAGAFGAMQNLFSSCAASTHDMHVVALQVTTQIPSGTVITITHRTTVAAKRGYIMAVFDGLVLPPVADATSGNTAAGTLGNVAAGPNASGTALESAATTASMPAGDHVLIGGFSIGGTSTITATGTGHIAIDSAQTTTGTSDRGMMLTYKNVSATGVQTLTATLSASGTWCAGVAALPLLVVGPPAPVASVIVGGVKKPITSMSVIVGGAKKTITSASVIVGGAKKPTA